MDTGRRGDRQRENRAKELAAEIAKLLTAIDTLGVGITAAANGRVTGPGFEIRRIADRWTVRA